MMRNIQFRGLSNSKKWVYGSLIYFGEQPMIEFVRKRHHDDNRVVATDWVYVDHDTVGQFTGLKDTSTPPKDIFEGDIIEGKTGIRHLIKYDEESAAFLAYKLPINEFDNGCHIENDWVVQYEKKVIGNKFENSNLMM